MHRAVTRITFSGEPQGPRSTQTQCLWFTALKTQPIICVTSDKPKSLGVPTRTAETITTRRIAFIKSVWIDSNSECYTYPLNKIIVSPRWVSKSHQCKKVVHNQTSPSSNTK